VHGFQAVAQIRDRAADDHAHRVVEERGLHLRRDEMIYRMPDYRSVLNTFVWQDYDLAPDYPKLFEFIEFWHDEIEGPLHSVRFTHRKMIAPGEWQNVTGTFTYH
jgi:uncharacterized protein Usg